MKRSQLIVAIVGFAVLFVATVSAKAQVWGRTRAPALVVPAPVVVSPTPVVVSRPPVVVSQAPILVASPRTYWVGRPYWRTYHAPRRVLYRPAWRAW
jgi:hypothetical protein